MFSHKSCKRHFSLADSFRIVNILQCYFSYLVSAVATKLDLKRLSPRENVSHTSAINQGGNNQQIMTIVVGLLFIVVSQYVQISTAQLSPFYWHNYHQHFELPPTDKAYATRVVQTKWFHHQQLDHFNATDTRQWNQRYFVNAQLHKPGGPVFLHISGESASDPNMMVYGQWYKWAKEHHALMLQLEHRYYGKSRPTE